MGFADPHSGIAFGYVMNHVIPRWQSTRNRALIDALYDSLGTTQPCHDAATTARPCDDPPLRLLGETETMKRAPDMLLECPGRAGQGVPPGGRARRRRRHVRGAGREIAGVLRRVL